MEGSTALETYQKTLQIVNASLHPLHTQGCTLRRLALLLMSRDILRMCLDEALIASDDVLQYVSTSEILVAACSPRGKLGSYLNQLILHIVAEARVLVAVPEILCVVLGGCAGGGVVTTVLRGSVCCRCHLVEIWKERFVVRMESQIWKSAMVARRGGRSFDRKLMRMAGRAS